MITHEQAVGAVWEMRICRYFPSEDLQRSQVAALLIRMVEGKEQLDWLISQQINFDWRGPESLRKLFCSRFSPLDGISADSELPGLTSAELEYGYLEAQGREFNRKMIEWKREQKLLGAPDPQLFDVSPAIKLIAPPMAQPIVKPAARRQESRTDQNVRKFLNCERLACIAGEQRPTRIRSTNVRTAEERQRLINEIEAELLSLNGATAATR